MRHVATRICPIFRVQPFHVYIFGKQSSYKLANDLGIEVLGELPISESLIKKHNIEHPIIMQKKSEVIFKSFFDICQKVLNKIKV